MLALITPCENHRAMVIVDRLTPEEREYEALATIRDVLLLLYSEISENTGNECLRLRSAFDYLDRLTAEMGQSA